MRRGCLSLGEVKCESCGCTVPYPERYLVVDEDEKGNEVEKGGKSVRYCVKDALKKGYARYEAVKGEKILTFLPQSEVTELPTPKEPVAAKLPAGKEPPAVKAPEAKEAPAAKGPANKEAPAAKASAKKAPAAKASKEPPASKKS